MDLDSDPNQNLLIKVEMTLLIVFTCSALCNKVFLVKMLIWIIFRYYKWGWVKRKYVLGWLLVGCKNKFNS